MASLTPSHSEREIELMGCLPCWNPIKNEDTNFCNQNLNDFTLLIDCRKQKNLQNKFQLAKKNIMP